MNDGATDPQQLSERIAQSSSWVRSVKEEISRVLVGQHELVDRLLIGLLCNGHILLEGMPGLAKTCRAKNVGGMPCHTLFCVMHAKCGTKIRGTKIVVPESWY